MSAQEADKLELANKQEKLHTATPVETASIEVRKHQSQKPDDSRQSFTLMTTVHKPFNPGEKQNILHELPLHRIACGNEEYWHKRNDDIRQMHFKDIHLFVEAKCQKYARHNSPGGAEWYMMNETSFNLHHLHSTTKNLPIQSMSCSTLTMPLEVCLRSLLSKSSLKHPRGRTSQLNNCKTKVIQQTTPTTQFTSH